MAASTFVPASSRRSVPRALVSAAAARTAPRGVGLAPVVALPVRGSTVESPSGASVEAVAVEALPRTVLRVVPASRSASVRRRSAVLAAVAVAAVLAVLGTVGMAAAGSDDLTVAGHVVLQPGETLWDIATRSAPAGVDPRRQLEDIRRVNGFGPGALDAWTVVLIPAR